MLCNKMQRLILVLPLFLVVVEGKKNHYLDDGVNKYLKCIEDNSGLKGEISPNDYFKTYKYITPETFISGSCDYEYSEETISGAMKRKGFSDACKPLTPSQDDRNNNLSPIEQKIQEKIVVTRSTKNASSSSVDIYGEVKSSAYSTGVAAEAKKTSGTNKTTESNDETTQSWERSFVIPPKMRGIKQLLQCKRLMAFPKETMMKMKGCLPIDFPKVKKEDISKSITEEIWLKCGKSAPVGWEMCTDKLLLRYENFADEWKANTKTGGLYRIYTDITLAEVPFTKFERKARFITYEAADESYCDSLDPNSEAELVEQETDVERIEVERIKTTEKDLGDFNWKFKPLFEDAAGDKKKDDEDEKEKDCDDKKKKCEGKNDGKNTGKKDGKQKQPGRHSKQKAK